MNIFEWLTSLLLTNHELLPSGRSCPGKLQRRSMNCFFVPDNLRASYERAGRVCAEYGAVLATIKDKDTDKFICDNLILPRIRHDHRNFWWIGLHNLQNESESGSKSKTGSCWHWSDSSTPAYRNFRSGQPNTGRGYDCAQMNRDGLWTTEVCWANYEFVCQALLVPKYGIVSKSIRNEDRCAHHGGMVDPASALCFWSPPHRASWTVALQFCRDQGGTLARINSLRLKELLRVELLRRLVTDKPHQEQRWWIGVQDFATQTESDWRFVDGTFAAFQYWRQNEPNGRSYENCVLTDESGYWIDDNCDSPDRMICEAFLPQ